MYYNKTMDISCVYYDPSDMIKYTPINLLTPRKLTG